MAQFEITDGPSREEMARSVWNGKSRKIPVVTFCIKPGKLFHLVITKVTTTGVFGLEKFVIEGWPGAPGMTAVACTHGFEVYGEYTPHLNTGLLYQGG